MKYIPDDTGRFHRRPYFERGELDTDCERIISEFLQDVHGEVRFPVRTDDLTKLVERDTEDLDLYADLSAEGPNVEGVTGFTPGQRPRVRISRALSEAPWAENRLRTTLTHEYGHVRFHTFVWELDSQNIDLFGDRGPREGARCNRDTMINAPARDWMEWQAGYISGALLMPIGPVNRLVADFRLERGALGRLNVDSDLGLAIIGAVSETFAVSEDAARVRLLQLDALTLGDPGLHLFS